MNLLQHKWKVVIITRKKKLKGCYYKKSEHCIGVYKFYSPKNRKVWTVFRIFFLGNSLCVLVHSFDKFLNQTRISLSLKIVSEPTTATEKMTTALTPPSNVNQLVEQFSQLYSNISYECIYVDQTRLWKFLDIG